MVTGIRLTVAYLSLSNTVSGGFVALSSGFLLENPVSHPALLLF